ncbi:DUF4232 domain-containing protein [Kitasatospora sp. A2-31]|uniref:DUF4232 domain-containing protein n=1 Tax=Kitasatospora sp. A2-31 TaxID=2916414 RepID=UPI001EEB9CE1|nr:DUF4232 domain-containing protein [Kitasatospora sp. A2-31]MCG6494805.1 DUF4232 domain-containing protein [Kitasatospora sp. A2-31]
MITARTYRTRLITAAAALALAAVALTACDDDAGADAGAAAPGTVATARPASATGTPVATPAPAGSKTSAGAAANARTSAVPAPPVTCEGHGTRTTAAPLNRPVNHMLLTVTNTGAGSCNLYGYPAVWFGEAPSVPPAIEDSHPQAVVTLRPGESGYATVRLAADDGSAANGHTVTSLAVLFHGPSGEEGFGAAAHPPLPATGAYVDDSLKVTYWQRSLDEALSW